MLLSLSNQKQGIKFLTLLLMSFMLFSCQRDEGPVDIPRVAPASFNSTTDYYSVMFPVRYVTPDLIRSDAEGAWMDEQGNVVLDIKRGYINPNYPTPANSPWESQYVYDVVSNVPEFPITNITKMNEIGINHNNLNLDNKFHLIVESIYGWLWVMTDKPYVIQVHRKAGSVRPRN